MGIDPRGLAQAMGDAEARLDAVREWGKGQEAKAAALDAVVTHQRDRIRELEAALQKIVTDGDYTAPEGMKALARSALSGEAGK